MTDKSIEWLKARKIGGSDAAAIIGAHPFRTAHEVWERLTGAVTSEIPMNHQMRMGILLEPIAADFYVEETGRKVRECKQRSHPDYDFITGNIDREILADGETPAGILEIKCPTIHTMAKVKREGLRDDMTVQIQHYLGIYGYEWGSFALFNQDAGFINFDLEADQDFISMLIEKEIEFWENHVVPKIPPPIDLEADDLNIPQVEGELHIVDVPKWREVARDLQEATELKKSAMELEKHSKEILQGLMNDLGADAVEIPDQARFYYRTHDGRTSWKKTAEKLAMESGLSISDFLEIGKSYRSFRSYFMGRGEE